MLTAAALVDPETIFGRFAFDQQRRIIAAVSGGSDSLALLILLHEFLNARGLLNRLRAVTIDHGLRPESAREAHVVAAICAELGVSHQTLVWTGHKPGTGLQSAARRARYDLLYTAAREAGAWLVTGHNRDDQEETVAMRRARGDGIGLSGIADHTLINGRVWLLRPLLATSREMLRDVLIEAGLSWADDPSNQNMRFERVRIRRQLTPTDRAECLATSLRAATERRSLAARAATLVDAFAARVDGCVTLGTGILRSPDPAAARHALRFLLRRVGGDAMLADAERTGAVCEHLAAGDMRTTLAHCVITRRRDVIELRREGVRRGGRDGGKTPPPLVSGLDYPLENRISHLVDGHTLPAPPVFRHEDGLL